MPVRLRIVPVPAECPENDRVRLALTLPGEPERVAESEFTFRVGAAEIADLAWYVEAFLQFPAPPAPERARAFEQTLARRGTELFALVFGAGAAAPGHSGRRCALEPARQAGSPRSTAGCRHGARPGRAPESSGRHPGGRR